MTTKTIVARVPRELADKLKAVADAENRTVTGQLIHDLKRTHMPSKDGLTARQHNIEKGLSGAARDRSRNLPAPAKRKGCNAEPFAPSTRRSVQQPADDEAPTMREIE